MTLQSSYQLKGKSLFNYNVSFQIENETRDDRRINSTFEKFNRKSYVGRNIYDHKCFVINLNPRNHNTIGQI